VLANIDDSTPKLNRPVDRSPADPTIVVERT
jgi:hypothetical protein